MRPAEVAALLRVRRPELNRERRVLAACYDLEALRAAARRRLPRAVFDYVDGGAEGEVTLRGNRAAFEAVRLVPDTLPGVVEPQLGVSLLGEQLALPIGLSPTGYSRLVHPDGELAVARAASAAGVPYVTSTVASTSVEDIAATGHRHLWAQLYLLKDRRRSWDFLQRCTDAGVRTLELAVDTAVAGFRTRDVRNGMSIPPQLSLRTVADVLSRPGYWTGYLRAPAMTFPNLAPSGGGGGSIQAITGAFESSLGWADLEQIRARWGGQLLLKGPISAADATTAVGLGVDGIQLSNHGGRQLDRVVSPLELLPQVRAALGDNVPVLLDSGVRSGADVAVAIALGADLVMIGRGYLYGLAVAGQAGVNHALGLLRDELTRSMHLLGAGTVAELRARGDHYLWSGGKR